MRKKELKKSNKWGFCCAFATDNIFGQATNNDRDFPAEAVQKVSSLVIVHLSSDRLED